MERITHRINTCAKAPQDSVEMADGAVQGTAIERLAQYEDLCEELLAKQSKIAQQMEELRMQGREKSVKFRELFAQKLTNASFLSLLQAKGLL